MKTLFLFIAILGQISITYAWGPSGHMTGGAIAYYYLKEHHPEVIQKVLKTLENHPWINSPEWTDKLAGLTTEQKEIALFMLASTFPDDARKNPELGGGEKTKWHYVDYPFVPDGETVKANPPQSPNAEEKLDDLFVTLKEEKESSQKAQDICWLFHLIEDIHQPLHCGSLFNANHPKGDRGGNDTYIVLKEGANPTKLHSYWDGLPKGTMKNIPQKAQDLLAKPEYAESKLIELTTNRSVSDWIKKESLMLAINNVYKKGKISGTKDVPTSITSDYIINAKGISERRILLCGIRLAQELVVIYS